jgi:tetrahydromethanopterin S-methyltransferase subunit A
MTTPCRHRLSGLPCVNREPHTGNGRGCVHVSASGSHVDDRHREGGHE